MNKQRELIQGEERECVQTQKYERTWHIYNLELKEKSWAGRIDIAIFIIKETIECRIGWEKMRTKGGFGEITDEKLMKENEK